MSWEKLVEEAYHLRDNDQIEEATSLCEKALQLNRQGYRTHFLRALLYEEVDHTHTHTKPSFNHNNRHTARKINFRFTLY
jgi:Tfp pilus assembly protein PilF